MKRKGLTIKINLTNRWLYTFILIGILAVVGVGVYAATYSASGAGHNANEIDFSSGEIASVGTIRDASGGWIRTYGDTGWYSETYGGGWYMTDTTWLRAYNNKNVYTAGQVRGDGGLCIGTDCRTAWPASTVISTGLYGQCSSTGAICSAKEPAYCSGSNPNNFCYCRDGYTKVQTGTSSNGVLIYSSCYKN